MITFEFGAMSSRYSLQAENKYDAYCAMVCFYDRNAHLIALYEPKEIIENDSWLNIYGKISDRLDEVFKDVGGFDKYIESHIDSVKLAYQSIKQLC